MNTLRIVLVLATLIGSGCAKAPEAPPSADSAGAVTPAMTMRGTTMIPALRVYLDSLARVDATAIPAAVGTHAGRMAEMLDAFGGDMSSMGMTADSSWAALTDSIRTDLADLPGLSGSVQRTRLTAHLGRVRRLLERHQTMMKGM